MFDNSWYDRWDPPETMESRQLTIEVVAAGRLENQAAARRLRCIAELFEMRRKERGETADWAVDTWAAVGAEVAAALRVSVGKAGSYMTYGLAMGKLPNVARVFEAGDIDMATFRTIVYRTELITDEEVLSEVDQLLAVRAIGWPSLSQGGLIREIDSVVNAWDPDAVRRVRERVRDRDVTIWDCKDGTADLSGRLFATDAQALDKRLDALAATVCDADPRTAAQRRADALGALASGAERLRCTCGTPECPSASVSPSPVVIHVVAEASTLRGDDDKTGYLLGTASLIPAELLRDLAASARLRPLTQPDQCTGEPHYRPSRRLADFIRARDLTCRAPGCYRPATDCDIDHTVPYGDGGATHASNLKALCRFHHLVKTFWGWHDKQLPDGTVIWTLPDGHTYVTTPGSALLFPGLCAPTGDAPKVSPRKQQPCRSVMMPRRKTTRAADRARRVASERASPH